MPERKERLAVLRDSLRDPQGRWLRGALWVLVLAALGAWLAVEAVALVRSEQRQHERNQPLEGMEQTLLSESSNGPLLGMVTLLGLSEPSLKAAAQGFLPYDAPPVLARLGVIRGRFMVDGAYVIARDGTVVAHDTAGNRTTGAQLGHRPYFQQALQGNASVYAALGGTSQERGLYYAAPLYESDTPSSPIIGVVTVKVGFSHFDRLLTRAGHPVLLMSPQGVVFSSTRPEWLYAMAAPLTQERIDAVRSTRQFGSRFDNGLVSALPFSIDSREALIDGVRYAVGRRAVGQARASVTESVEAVLRAVTRLYERTRFDLDGNPDPDRTWTTQTIEYIDVSGQLGLFECPLTPATFALGETRFVKQFSKLPVELDAIAVPVEQYIDLPESSRGAHVPFIWSTDADLHLIKVRINPAVVSLVEERRRYWQLLQYLAGVNLDRLTALHKSDLADLQSRYDQAMAARESSMDEIARAMSELAASTNAQPVTSFGSGLGGLGMGGGAPAPSVTAAEQTTGQPIVRLDPDDIAKCTDCKNCWQELPELFERTKVIVDGQAKVAHQFAHPRHALADHTGQLLAFARPAG